MRQYESMQEIKKRLPAEKGYIVMTAGGSTVIIGQDDEMPTQKICLMGVIEK